MRRAALLAVIFFSFLCVMVSVVGANTDAITLPDQAVLRSMDNPGHINYWDMPTQNATPPPNELSFTENEAYAAGQEIGGGYFRPVEPTPPQKRTPTSEPPDDDSAQDNAGSNNQDNGSSDTNITYHLGGLGENITTGVKNSFGQMIKELVIPSLFSFQKVVNITLSSLLYGDSDLIQEPRMKGWLGMMGITVILIPLSLSFVAVQGLKNGASSITGYAMAREALIEWGIAIAAAASSYFLLSKANELSSALMKAIFTTFFGSGREILGISSIVEIFKKLQEIHTVNTGSNDLGNTVLLIFAFVVGFALMVAIVLGMISRQVIIMFSFVIAPIILLIGTIPMFRWIRGIWLKVTVIAFLLGPLNILMICLSAVIIDGFDVIRTDLSADVSNMILYLVLLGIISVLIGINSLIGKSVYSSVIEIAKGALDFLTSALKIGMGIVTAGAGNIASGAALISGRAAGNKAVTEAVNPSIGPGGSGIIGPNKTTQNQASLTKQKGQTLSKSSLKPIRNYGVGLQQGALEAEQELLSQSIKAGFPPETPLTSDPGVTEKHKQMRTSGASEQNPPMKRIPDAQVHQRIDSAEGAYNNMLVAMDNMKWNTNLLLPEFGMDKSAFQHYGFDKFAFPNDIRVDTPNLEDIRSEAGKAVYAGIEIASNVGTPDNKSNDWTLGRWQDLYKAMSIRRDLGYSFETITNDATTAHSIADWIQGILEGK